MLRELRSPESEMRIRPFVSEHLGLALPHPTRVGAIGSIAKVSRDGRVFSGITDGR